MDMAHERRLSDSGNEYVDANAVFSQVILYRNVTLIAWNSFPLLFLNYAQQAFFCCRQVFLCCRQCAWSTSLFLQLVDSHQDWINWEQMDKSSLCQRHEEEKILFCRQTLQKDIHCLISNITQPGANASMIIQNIIMDKLQNFNIKIELCPNFLSIWDGRTSWRTLEIDIN